VAYLQMHALLQGAPAGGMSAVDLGAGWLQKPGWTTKRTIEKPVEARATSRVIGQLKDGFGGCHE
jgi:hypothetical protein